MDNKKLRDKYRAQLLMANAVTITIVSLVEIAAYVILVHNGLCEFALSSTYLWFSVIMPVFINVATHITVRIINKSDKFSHKFKNEMVIYGISVTAIVVAVIHRDYIVTSCAYVFPIVLSAMYNQKKLLGRCLIVSLISLTATVFILGYEGKMDLTYTLNIIVSYSFVAVSYLAGYISVEFSRRNSVVIENQAIANNQLQSRVLRDQMTGLYNHRAFFMEFDASIESFKADKTDFCLAMIDVDDFKKVNDTYGHDCGDAVLLALANVLDSNCDVDDRACRYGGEEFAVIFNNKSLWEAEQIMKKGLENFVNIKYDFTCEPITFSCGVAQYSSSETRETLFNLADRCMYSAKQNGKNQVKIECA